MLLLLVGPAVVAILIAQVLVTFRLWRSDLYEPGQKILQTGLVWLLPAVGAAVVYAGLRHHDDVPRLAPNRASGEHASLWDNEPASDAPPPPDPGAPGL